MSASARTVRSQRARRSSSSYASQMRAGEEEGEISSEYCSSGCQSGWTTYFEQSSVGLSKKVVSGGVEEEEEEDMSMVSDASSGPPQLREDGGDLVINYIAGPKNAKKGGEKKKHGVEASSALADTATSPLISHDPKLQSSVVKRQCVEGELDFWRRFSPAPISRCQGKEGRTEESRRGLKQIGSLALV